jgi:hypothetical protein
VSEDAAPRLVRQCACGYPLQEWRFEAKGRATGVWCAGLGDLANYRLNRSTRHDVLDLRGRRVQRGECEQHSDAGPPK